MLTRPNNDQTQYCQAVLKARGLRDDITVLVIDALPDGSARLPPLLTKNGSGQLEAAVHPANVVNIYHPLEDSEKAAGAWQHLVWCGSFLSLCLTYTPDL